MNLIPRIAKSLGVEIGEKFEIDKKFGTYEFTEFGVKGTKNEGIEPYILNDLMTGDYKVIKIHWKPEINDRYWYFGTDKLCHDRIWTQDVFDLENYYSGNCFEKFTECQQMGRALVTQMIIYYGEGRKK